MDAGELDGLRQLLEQMQSQGSGQLIELMQLLEQMQSPGQLMELMQLLEQLPGQDSGQLLEMRKQLEEQVKQLKQLKKLSSMSTKKPQDDDEEDDKEEPVSNEVSLFLGAVAAGHVAFLTMMLTQRNVDVNARGRGKATALHIAAHEAKSDVLNFLLSQNADLNAVDKDGDTPLMVAVIKRHKAIIRLLADRGADLTVKNKRGFTAADLAFIAEDLETVSYLEGKTKALQFDPSVHDETILSFAQKNSIKMIEFWLANCPPADGIKPCDFRYKGGRTIAFTAALNGSEELIGIVDSLGGDLDLPDDSNSSPLFCAAQNGYDNIVKRLIDWGCNVNRVRDTGRTALFSAIVNGHFEIVRILTEAGANVNIVDKTGTGSLACSIVSGCEEIFHYLLLECEADPHVVDKKGNDLVLLAALFKRFGLLKILHEVKQLPLDEVNKVDGETPLLSACQVGPVEMVEYLIEKGCNVNCINKKGVTPALRAAFNSHLDIVVALANRRAALDIPNRIGETAILVSAQKGSLPLVEFLHKKGCDIMVADEQGCTLASYAAARSDEKLMDFLKRNAAPLDVPDHRGRTPLMIAVSKPPSMSIVRALIDSSCNLSAKNNKGETAMSIAVKEGSIEVVDHLLSVGENFSNISRNGKTPLMQAAKANQKASVRKIRQTVDANSLDVNATDRKRRSAVHLAARAGHIEVLELLIDDLKADCDIKDADGNTPLLLAVRNKQKQVVEKLVSVGADVNVRNHKGENAAHLAVLSDSLEILRFLEQADCHLDQEAKDGTTPLRIACARKNMPIVNFLLSKDAFAKSFTKDGRQVIHAACETGNYQIVNRLLNLNIPVHAVDKDGITTLMLAALAGSKETVDVLHGRRSDLVKMRDHSGKSALEYAIIGGHTSLLQHLVQLGCSVNCNEEEEVEKRRLSPLMLAVEHCGEEAVKQLLQLGATADAVGPDGVTAAHVASRENKLPALKLLADSGAQLDVVTDDGDCCLTLAMPSASIEVVQLLLTAKLCPRRCNKAGNSALALAYLRGNVDIVDKLPELEDQDKDASFARGNSLLHLACRGGSDELVRRLLRHGLSPNSVNADGRTPLHEACANGSVQATTQLLQEENVQLDARDAVGETPLMLATEKGSDEICQLLVDRGADVSSRNSDGVSVLAKAIHQGSSSIVGLLRSRDAQLSAATIPSSFEVFQKNLKNRKFGHLRTLMREGLSVDRREGNSHLLHMAIQGTRSDVVEMLLRLGANTRVRDHLGDTPFLTAVRVGRIDIAHRLLQDTNCEEANDNDENALHVAVMEGKLSTVRWMLDNFDFNRTAKTKRGHTALHLAAALGCKEIFELLLLKGWNPSEKDEQGMDVSQLAAMSGNPHFVQHLHDKRMLQMATARGRQWPLALLAADGQLQLVKWLTSSTGVNLEEDRFLLVRNAAFGNGHESLAKWLLAQPGVADESPSAVDGETPLLCAAQSGNFHLCRELLIKRNHAIDVVSSHGVGVLQKAVVSGSEPLIRFLVGRGAPREQADNDGDTPLLEAVNLRAVRLLRLLHQEFGCDLHRKNRLQRNAVHLAAFAGCLESLRYLLRHLPIDDFADTDENGDTPIMLAVLKGNDEAVRFILEQCGQAGLHTSNNKGSSPLHWAAATGCSRIAELLLDTGAAVDAVDCDGATPLMLATRAKAKEVVDLLLNRQASVTVANNFGDNALSLMKFCEEESIAQIAERLSNGDEIQPLQHAGSLGHMTCTSLHFYDHFPEQRPPVDDETEDRIGDDAEEDAAASTAAAESTLAATAGTRIQGIDARSERRDEGRSDARGPSEDARSVQRRRFGANEGTRSHRSGATTTSCSRVTVGEYLEQPAQSEGQHTQPQHTLAQPRPDWRNGSVQWGLFVVDGSCRASVASTRGAHIDAEQQRQWRRWLKSVHAEAQRFDPQDTELDLTNLCSVLDLTLQLNAGSFSLELTMEQPGRRLDELLDTNDWRLRHGSDRCRLTEETAVSIVRAVLSGLSVLHNAGVAHGSLCLGCLWLSDIERPGSVKVGLYGRLMQLVTGAVCFGAGRQPLQSAPELQDGRRSSRATDVWSFCVLLHELLLRSPPQAGAELLDDEYIRRVAATDQPDVVFPESLRRLFPYAYREEPSQRKTVADLLQMLPRSATR